jgi:hypothetical protein
MGVGRRLRAHEAAVLVAREHGLAERVTRQKLELH